MQANPHPSVLKPSANSQALKVELPYNFTPRDYQRDDLFRPLFPHHFADLKVLGVQRKKRICMVHHRRAGKDISVLNALTLAAWEEPGNYLYLLPEQTQAKKVIWRGIDGGETQADGTRSEGRKFTDYIPEAIIKKKYESEMLVEFTNGSTIQIGGSDNYDSWMGTNPRGIVLSEYSLQDPAAWDYLRPILAENGGWAAFIYTARGKNHGYKLYNIAKNSPEVWACSLRTIKGTKRPDGSPVITMEQYQQEIDDGMPESRARQEFFCDFEAALLGAYYGEVMERAEKDKRIGFFPYDPAHTVFTAWDVGNDANVVWFIQKDGSGFRAIDYYEAVNTKFSEACKEVAAKPYSYGAHFAPHDTKNRDSELESKRIETALNHGIELIVTPRESRDDGIEAVRQMVPRTRFNLDTCERGIDCMKSYERMWDEKLKTFREIPMHNWASHGADAFRIFAMNWDDSYTDDSWLNEDLGVDAGEFV